MPALASSTRHVEEVRDGAELCVNAMMLFSEKRAKALRPGLLAPSWWCYLACSAHQAAHRDRARRAGQEAAIFRSVLLGGALHLLVSVVDPAVDICPHNDAGYVALRSEVKARKPRHGRFDKLPLCGAVLCAGSHRGIMG